MRRYIVALGLSMFLAGPAPAQSPEDAEACQCLWTGVCLCQSPGNEAPAPGATPQDSATSKPAPRDSATRASSKTTTATVDRTKKYAVVVPKVHAPTVAKRKARSRAKSQRRQAMSAAMREQLAWQLWLESLSSGGGGGGRVSVRGYTRKDGTYVRPHTRRR